MGSRLYPPKVFPSSPEPKSASAYLSPIRSERCLCPPAQNFWLITLLGFRLGLFLHLGKDAQSDNLGLE